MATQFLSIRINGDPLSATSLTAGIVETVLIVDDDGALESSIDDTSGPQFSIGGVNFTSSAFPGSIGPGVEIYSADVTGGGTVTFGYLTAQFDGIGDNINRIVILSGSLAPGQVLTNINTVSNNTELPYTKDFIPSVTCFTPGTTITTPTGPRLVEELNVGDLVITADNGMQAIRWIGRKLISGARLQAHPHLRPIRIQAHALGHNKPEKDLCVSPQHKVFVRSNQAELMYGSYETLMPAKGLLNDHTIMLDNTIKSVEYIHILFDKHELIQSNGIWTESFHPNKSTINGLADAARDELLEIFPELNHDSNTYGPSARHSLSVTQTKDLQVKYTS